MDINAFIKRLEEEFEDIEPGKLKPESKFRDEFEWNSVNALIIIALVDSEFDVTLTADDIRNAKTINDLYKIIKDRAKN